jgi:hypothetical protein
MSCNTLANRYEPCKQFVGGIRGAFFVPYVFSNVVTKDASGLVTSINNGASPTPVNVTGWFWELKGLSTLEVAPTVSRDNGNTMYTQTFTLSFKPSGVTPTAGDLDMDTIQTLNQGRWRIILWDRNDQFWLLGEDEGCDSTGGSLSWGTQMGDARLNTLTFVGSEKAAPTPVDAETYAEVLTVITVPA